MNIGKGLLNQNGETDTKGFLKDMSFADNQEGEKRSTGRDHGMCKDAEAASVLINLRDSK